MKKQTEIDEEQKVIEKSIRRWENEGGEVLEIAKLKTITATEDQQNDARERVRLVRHRQHICRKKIETFIESETETAAKAA